jgi:hypothetical protein
MFRPLTMVIFRLRLRKLSKQLYSTYVGCIHWGDRGEVGTRSRMCYVGWVVWVHGFCFLFLYDHATHNDVAVNDGPHIRRWSHNIIIL